jgi:hypothetical protein
MTKLFPEYKRSTVYAIIGAVFHFVVVVLPLSFMEMYSILSGNGYGGKLIEIYFHFVFFVVYLPFAFLNLNLRQLLAKLDMSGETNLFIAMAVVGTILYTLSGWLIGYLTDKYSQSRLIK